MHIFLLQEAHKFVYEIGPSGADWRSTRANSCYDSKPFCFFGGCTCSCTITTTLRTIWGLFHLCLKNKQIYNVGVLLLLHVATCHVNMYSFFFTGCQCWRKSNCSCYSPLVALMGDQVKKLNQNSIRAGYIGDMKDVDYLQASRNQGVSLRS